MLNAVSLRARRARQIALVVKTKTKPVTDNSTKLMIHIVQRDENDNMKDKTLCGKLWDHPVVITKEICPECKEIAKRDNHDWRA